MNRKFIALLPFVLILVFILLFYLSGAYHFFTFPLIQQEYLRWKAFVHAHLFLSSLYFIGVYVISVILVIPDSTILTILGGFLFPMPLAICYVCLSETLGGTLFFLAARLAFIETLGKKKIFGFNRMEKKFQENQVSYLLFFRFSHLLPFWFINLCAGLFHLRTWTFIWTTFIGVFPLTYFLVESGSSLSKYFETHTHFILKEIFTPQLKIALIVLGCLAFLPMLIKKLKSRYFSKNFFKRFY